MADRSFLAWPFFDAAHRTLAEELDRWAGATLAGAGGSHAMGAHATGARLDNECRSIARALGEAGWLSHGGAEPSGLNPNGGRSPDQGSGTRQPSRPGSTPPDRACIGSWISDGGTATSSRPSSSPW